MNDSKNEIAGADAADTASASTQEETVVDLVSETPEEYHASMHDDERRDEIRRAVIAKRAELPKPYRLHKSSAICDELEASLDLTCALTDRAPEDCIIAVYSAFDEEVQLDQFIRTAYKRGAKVAFPCLMNDAWGVEGAPEQTMEMRVVPQSAYEAGSVLFIARPLKKLAHDSEELEGFPYVPGSELTMIVIPLVAFDAHKNRLGYGGGNYDRYLPQLSPECRQIAVAFTEQEVPYIPTEEHDVPVNVLAR